MDDPGATPGLDDDDVDALAGQPLDDLDADLLATVAEVLTTRDPPPSGLVERATFAVALEELHVEVATLQREATTSERGLVGVRSTDDATLTMTFTAAAVALTLAVVETSTGRHRMDGWVTSAQPVTVTLRLGERDPERRMVEDGRFVFEAVPSGMVQVLVSSDDDDTATVVTPVFEL